MALPNERVLSVKVQGNKIILLTPDEIEFLYVFRLSVVPNVRQQGSIFVKNIPLGSPEYFEVLEASSPNPTLITKLKELSLEELESLQSRITYLAENYEEMRQNGFDERRFLDWKRRKEDEFQEICKRYQSAVEQQHPASGNSTLGEEPNG